MGKTGLLLSSLSLNERAMYRFRSIKAMERILNLSCYYQGLPMQRTVGTMGTEVSVLKVCRAECTPYA